MTNEEVKCYTFCPLEISWNNVTTGHFLQFIESG